VIPTEAPDVASILATTTVPFAFRTDAVPGATSRTPLGKVMDSAFVEADRVVVVDAIVEGG
jgi:hypothetical protein